jgi:hypothetical protein
MASTAKRPRRRGGKSRRILVDGAWTTAEEQYAREHGVAAALKYLPGPEPEPGEIQPLFVDHELVGKKPSAKELYEQERRRG